MTTEEKLAVLDEFIKFAGRSCPSLDMWKGDDTGDWWYFYPQLDMFAWAFRTVLTQGIDTTSKAEMHKLRKLMEEESTKK